MLILAQIPFVPEAVEGPNVMTPGAWIIVAIVLAGVIAGVASMIIRYFKNIHIPYKRLEGSAFGVWYFAQSGDVNTFLLLLSFTKAVELLQQHCGWSELNVLRAFKGVHIYIMSTPSWRDYWSSNKNVAGLDPAGDAIVVGSDLAALLHELAHQYQDVVDGFVDYEHLGWMANGIRKAEEEFAKWLSTQPTPSRIT